MDGLANDGDVEVGALEEGDDLAREQLDEGLALQERIGMSGARWNEMMATITYFLLDANLLHAVLRLQIFRIDWDRADDDG